MGKVISSLLLDPPTHVVYLPSRMNRYGATGWVGHVGRAITRIFLLSLPLIFLLQLLGQPDVEDRYPLFGTRSVSAKILKQDHSSKIGSAHILQLSLAVGSRLFTPGFYLTFVRNVCQQEFVRTPLVSLRSSRSPPCVVVA